MTNFTEYQEHGATAKVIADSISPYGIRITTLQLRYPRFIHAEFMTHRVFSRNARSSRAVPVSKLMAEAPYVPHFMKNQKGMQSFEELDASCIELAKQFWLGCIDECKNTAQGLMELGVHKQWANRMLEWFGYIDVVVTSTSWANFFNLRDHPMAMPEIQHLATAIKKSMEASTPVERHDTWHLPYITDEDRTMLSETATLLCSTARCARVSYAPFDNDGIIDIDKDLDLAKKLIGEDPLHASPAEHQAYPARLARTGSGVVQQWDWLRPELQGNFYGWEQHRKIYGNENCRDKGHSIVECIDYVEGRR